MSHAMVISRITKVVLKIPKKSEKLAGIANIVSCSQEQYKRIFIRHFITNLQLLYEIKIKHHMHLIPIHIDRDYLTFLCGKQMKSYMWNVHYMYFRDQRNSTKLLYKRIENLTEKYNNRTISVQEFLKQISIATLKCWYWLEGLMVGWRSKFELFHQVFVMRKDNWIEMLGMICKPVIIVVEERVVLPACMMYSGKFESYIIKW